MFLPPRFRIVAIGVYLHLSWMFLSFGTVIFCAGVLTGLERRVEAFPLLAVGPLLIYVGLMALDRLRQSMNGSGLGF